jgi:hypothetical protein
MLIATAFLLFAEERDMLPEDEVFVRYYSIAGLYDSATLVRRHPGHAIKSREENRTRIVGTGCPQRSTVSYETLRRGTGPSLPINSAIEEFQVSFLDMRPIYQLFGVDGGRFPATPPIQLLMSGSLPIRVDGASSRSTRGAPLCSASVMSDAQACAVS